MRSLFINFSNILCCLLFIFSVSAQTGTNEDVPITQLGTIHNEGEGIHTQNEYCLDDNNDLTVFTNIILGGLDIQGTSPDLYGVIPAAYPDMYIEYTINGVVYAPIPLGNFDLIELPNGYSAFSYLAQSPTIDFSDECTNVTEEAPYIYTTVSFRLVTDDGSGWGTYPACDYAQSWGMFSCLVYDYAPWCNLSAAAGFGAPDDPSPTCYDEWFSGGFSAYLYCDCEGGGPTRDDDEPISDGGDYLIEDNSGSNSRHIVESEVLVYPNPMDNTLNIASKDDYINKVELFDSRGAVLISNEYEGYQIENIRINTSDLPHGLYMVIIATNSGIKISKVLK